MYLQKTILSILWYVYWSKTYLKPHIYGPSRTRVNSPRYLEGWWLRVAHHPPAAIKEVDMEYEALTTEWYRTGAIWGHDAPNRQVTLQQPSKALIHRQNDCTGAIWGHDVRWSQSPGHIIMAPKALIHETERYMNPEQGSSEVTMWDGHNHQVTLQWPTKP